MAPWTPWTPSPNIEGIEGICPFGLVGKSIFTKTHVLVRRPNFSQELRAITVLYGYYNCPPFSIKRGTAHLPTLIWSSATARHGAQSTSVCLSTTIATFAANMLPLRTNLIIILGMMQVSKKIPFDDPQVLLGVRILYVVTNIIIAGVYLYLQNKINAKKGMLSACPMRSPRASDQDIPHLQI